MTALNNSITTSGDAVLPADGEDIVMTDTVAATDELPSGSLDPYIEAPSARSEPGWISETIPEQLQWTNSADASGSWLRRRRRTY